MVNTTPLKSVYFLGLVFLVHFSNNPSFFAEGSSKNSTESSNLEASEFFNLFELYKSFKFPPNQLSSWKNFSNLKTPCNCYGIKCNSQNQIISLSLSNLKLSGNISPIFSKFFNLESLDLSDNFFSGLIPKDFAKLSHLIVLNLHNNSLSGSIPEDLSKMKNLKLMDLSYNQLQGSVPDLIFQMASLRSLIMKSNFLYGSIALNLEGSSLVEINLDNNQFNGSISVSPNCSKKSPLFSFSADNNKISGKIPFLIAKCSSLQYLSLVNNVLEGEIDDNIGTESIKILKLRNNKLNGSIPSALSHLVNLTILDLSKNSLDGELPNSLEMLSNLKTLDLSFNNLTGVVPLSLTNSVPRLNIEGTKLTLASQTQSSPLVTSDEPADMKPCQTESSVLRYKSESATYEDPCLKSQAISESSKSNGYQWKKKFTLRVLIPVVLGLLVFLTLFIALAVVVMGRLSGEKKSRAPVVGFRTLDVPRTPSAASPRMRQDAKISMGMFSPRVKAIFSPRQNPEELNEEIFAYGIQPFTGKAMPAASYKSKSSLPPNLPSKTPNQASRFAPSQTAPSRLTIQIPSPLPFAQQ